MMKQLSLAVVLGILLQAPGAVKAAEVRVITDRTASHLTRLFALSYPKLYGVIFLAYKQVGRGEHYHHTLAALEPAQVYHELRQAFLALSNQTRVGYDCCLTPGVVGFEPTLDFARSDQLEGCSALRSSVGILPSLDLTPCTFTPERVIGNLREEPLADLWRKPQAYAFRQ